MSSNPKVLVTGATGFIGSHLIVKLINLNFEVMVISRNKSPNLSKNISWLVADIASFDEIKDKIQNFQPEVVIHLAWQGLPDYSLEASQINLEISIDFLEYISKLNSCKKIVVSGSCWEYGKEDGACNENDDSISNNHFTWAKNSLKNYLETLCKTNNIDLIWFRIFFTYGPFQRKSSLVPSILLALKDKSLPDIKTPNNSNDFIFIEDAVKGFTNAITKNIPAGIYNLGSGKSTSIIDVCKIAEEVVLGSNDLTDLITLSKENTKATVNFWASTEKTRKYLSWEPEIDLEEGITRTFQVLMK